jgi:hypothetical protein
MEMVAIVVMDDGRESWDVLGDCKVALVTKKDLKRMMADNNGEGCDNPLDYAVAEFKGSRVSLKKRG